MSTQFDTFQNEVLRSMLLEMFHISIVISIEYKKKLLLGWRDSITSTKRKIIFKL